MNLTHIEVRAILFYQLLSSSEWNIQMRLHRLNIEQATAVNEFFSEIQRGINSRRQTQQESKKENKTRQQELVKEMVDQKLGLEKKPIDEVVDTIINGELEFGQVSSSTEALEEAREIEPHKRRNMNKS